MKLKAINFWFILSLGFSIFYGCLGLQQAFSSEYVVQDDARQHVFWMLRYIDSNLFPNDLIADYFQSIAPLGYKKFYHLAANLGINPLFLNKILPIFLGAIATVYCFFLSLEIIPISATAFISSLIFNQNIWSKDDLVSATPRAFVYPLLLVFLYYLSRRFLLPCLIAIALIGLFYPQSIFLCCGMLILQLFKWEKGWRFSQKPQDYRFCLLGLGVAFLIMLPYALTTSEFAPIVTVAQAKQLPEFLPGGRSEFFKENIVDFFLFGDRSGIFPRYIYQPLIICTGLFLPLLLKFPNNFPLASQIKPKIFLLPQLLFISLGMFIFAHLLLFKLHLPNRYTAYSLRIILALSAGITISLMVDGVLYWASQRKNSSKIKQAVAFIFTISIAIILLFYPLLTKKFPHTNYVVGETPTLYKYFQKQPKDIIIASLADEVNNLPAFTKRSILVGREYAIPYHWGYYSQFRQRVIDLIQAQYSSDLEKVNNFVKTYKVNFLLLDKKAFTPTYFEENRWIQQYQPYATEAKQQLEQGEIPIVAKTLKRCSTFEVNNLIVLEAQCIVK